MTFEHKQAQQAIDHAAAGGQALLLHRAQPRERGAAPGEVIGGRLYDQDLHRLQRTVRLIRLPSAIALKTGSREQHVLVPAHTIDRARRVVGQESQRLMPA